MQQHIQLSTERDTPKNPLDPWTSYRAAMNLPLRGHLSPSLLAAPTLPTTIMAGTPRQPLQGSAIRKEHGPWYDTKDGMFPPHDRLAAVDAGTFIVRFQICALSAHVCVLVQTKAPHTQTRSGANNFCRPSQLVLFQTSASELHGLYRT